MIGIIVFHILMVLLGLGIVSRIVPPRMVSNLLGYLHNTIGITTPSPQMVQMVALIWIASVIVIVDGCLLLLVFIARLAKAG